MKSWKTKNGYEVFKVSGCRSNVFLISSANGNIIIDTGKKSSFGRLRKNIDSLKLDQQINYLILTHTHFDHCQNALTIRQQENCVLIMSEKELIFVQNGYTPLPNGTFPIARFISDFGRIIGRPKFGYSPFTPDMIIGEEFDLSDDGFNIKIISTYGHSPGSISIIIDNEIAVVGDAMFGTYNKNIFPPFADDIPGMIDSWGKLLKTNCRLYLPGHGKEIKRELLQLEYYKYAKKYNIIQTRQKDKRQEEK